tara:strand:- start:1914 stop:2105 length:192 start_codon:yes stop_codon:yes gene_type:complete
MTRTLYSLNESGQTNLKALISHLEDGYIDAVMELESQMDAGDMPFFENTVFGAEHFDTILVAN